MKSSLLAIFSILTFLPAMALAGGGENFTPLVGIPGLQNTNSFDSYVDALYALAISVAALVAVVKIVLAGAKYMMDDIVTHKSEAKEDIKNALIGLLIIIGAVVILNTINSDLTNLNINATPVELDNSVENTGLDRILEECSGENCTFFSCIDLQQTELSYTLPGQKGGNCDDKCTSMGGIVFSRESDPNVNRQCAVSESSLTSTYENELANATLNIPECSKGSCVLQYCDFGRISAGIAIQPGDGCEDLCESDNGIFDSSTSGCVLTNAATNKSGVILRVDPNIEYTYYTPAVEFNGEIIPPGENNGQTVMFVEPLQLNDGGYMVKTENGDGLEFWTGCDTIRPNPCI